MSNGEIIGGQTAEEFLRELFEFELCAECFGDATDHVASPDPLGKWHAWCTFKAPRMTHIVTTINPAKGNERPVRIEEVDTGRILAEVFAYPTDKHYSRQRLTYGSALEIKDEKLSEAAQDLVRSYREKKHNES
ncbi:hypothetical protein ACFYP4_02325 [Streptomyces sp. NPDC005551]|uniref:hypothetical protein n=1 Tax=Streptomyces sp. NPDC005551 TaxID=3364725 RepID=UPI003694DA5A